MKRIKPGPGQESVWDYPRPPRLEQSRNHIRVVAAGVVIADSANTFRVLETSHPPVYYVPPGDVKLEYLLPAEGTSFCEWKGMASYFDLKIEERVIPQACWTYLAPTKRFEEVSRYLAFYPSKMEQCFVNDEMAQAQDGDFYGGWITSDIVGPFKGAPGTFGW